MKAFVTAAILALAVSPVLANARLTIESSAPERFLRVLASPEFGGRMTLAPSMYKTADYIAGEFGRMGLKPAGNEGWFFTYDLTVNQRPAKMNAARFWSGDREWVLEMGKDWVPLVGSKHQTMFTGDVVFVGSKSAAQVSDFDGKWVLMYRTNPSGARATSAATRASEFAAKGAKGVIFAGPIGEGRLELPMFARPQGISNQANVLGLAITRDVFERVTGLKWGTEVDAAKPLDLKLRAVTDLEPNRGRGRCVIGILPGNDPKVKDEIIVMGAHHDHLGYGEVGSRTGNDILHLGADDNASGVAGLMALAEYFTRTKSNRRTILFQAYSGEEIGLLGARAWVRDNADTAKRINMMINMDMIGRLRDGALTVFCADSAPQFASILDSIQVDGVKVNKVMSSPGNSDHAPFIAARIPSLFFHTGLHDEYHTERDTVDTINWQGISQVLEVVLQTYKAVDQIDNRLVFSARQASTGGGDPNRQRRVRVGFMPDMGAEDARGVRLSGVVGGSPAEAAGVKAGDVLVSFDGKQVRSVEDLQRVLTEAQAGKSVVVVVIRGEQRLELTLTPTAPQS